METMLMPFSLVAWCVVLGSWCLYTTITVVYFDNVSILGFILVDRPTQTKWIIIVLNSVAQMLMKNWVFAQFSLFGHYYSHRKATNNSTNNSNSTSTFSIRSYAFISTSQTKLYQTEAKSNNFSASFLFEAI